MSLLEIKNIKKSFGDLEVLKDISFSVDKSEVISILGPSGSGKTTLLRCMTMLDTIDSGSMSYCGEKAVSTENGRAVYAPARDLRRIHGYFGMVFQNFNLFPHYSVLKNVTDAPTIALDPELTAGILKLLKDLAAEKMTMVIVTHEIDFARAVSDRVIFIDGGVIVEQGTPAEVIDSPSNERTRAFLKKMAGE